jgi:1-phosphofructokinase family hexose kinase
MITFQGLEKHGVNRALHVEEGVGGKGANTARVLSQMGADPTLLGFVGGENGRRLERMLDAEGVRYQHVSTEGETRICQTLLEEGRGDPTELVEEMPPLSKMEWSQMEDLISKMDLSGKVSVSGKLPKGAPEQAFAWITKKVQEAGGQIVLDVPGVPLLEALAQKPFWVKMNYEELSATLGKKTNLEEGAKELLYRGAKNVLITQGASSAFLLNEEGAWTLFPPRIQAVNPVGSGDATTAGILLELASGKSALDAVRLGMACGAANALHLHCGVVTPSEVERLFEQVVWKEVE